MSGQNGAVVAWTLPRPKTLEEWGNGLKWLVNFNKNWRWILGKYLVEGEELYQERIWQYVDHEDLKCSKNDVLNCMWVYRAIRDQYTAELPWTWWQSMAKLPKPPTLTALSKILQESVTPPKTYLE